MYIRFFACTDNSELGAIAARYCDVLLATGIPVRLVSTRAAELQLNWKGRSNSIWDRHRSLLITPMIGRCVNVVCANVAEWSKLWTNDMLNILLVAEQNLAPCTAPADITAYAAHYDGVFSHSRELADLFDRTTGRDSDVAEPDKLRWFFEAAL